MLIKFLNCVQVGLRPVLLHLVLQRETVLLRMVLQRERACASPYGVAERALLRPGGSEACASPFGCREREREREVTRKSGGLEGSGFALCAKGQSPNFLVFCPESVSLEGLKQPPRNSELIRYIWLRPKRCLANARRRREEGHRKAKT